MSTTRTTPAGGATAGKPRTADRRIERTRRLLGEALISLILEKGFEAITVQDLIDRADVGRSTFYSHFADKEDLLASGLANLSRGLRDSRPQEARQPLAFSLGLIMHALEHRRLFRVVVSSKTSLAVQREFRQLLIDLISEDLAGRGGALTEPTVRFLAGALMELLSWWLEAEEPLPASEVDRMFRKLSHSAVEAALGQS